MMRMSERTDARVCGEIPVARTSCIGPRCMFGNGNGSPTATCLMASPAAEPLPDDTVEAEADEAEQQVASFFVEADEV